MFRTIPTNDRVYDLCAIAKRSPTVSTCNSAKWKQKKRGEGEKKRERKKKRTIRKRYKRSRDGKRECKKFMFAR